MAENDKRPSEDELNAHRNEGYRALGRFLVSVTGVVELMRRDMDFFGQATGDHPALKGVKGRALGSSADTIRKGYFTLCERLYEHAEDEAAAARKLQNLVEKEIEMRNRVVHGVLHIGWWISEGQEGGGMSPAEPEPPSVWGVNPGQQGTPTYSEVELDAHSDQIERLAKLLWEYGHVCFRMRPPEAEGGEVIRVRDVVYLEETEDGTKQPVLGPKASPYPLHLW